MIKMDLLSGTVLGFRMVVCWQGNATIIALATKMLVSKYSYSGWLLPAE